LLAHWARFVSPGVEAFALGLEQYARIGIVVSLVTDVPLAPEIGLVLGALIAWRRHDAAT